MLSGPRLYRVILCAALFIGLGFIANPWIVQSRGLFDPVGDGLLMAVGLLGIVYSVGCCVRKLWWPAHLAESERSCAEPLAPRQANRHRAWLLLAFLVIGTLWVVMFRQRLLRPVLFLDDFQYIAIGRSWATTVEQLFTPYNEHLCVATRLLTWLLCAAASDDHLPRAMALSGMVLFVATWVPLYLFVQREFGSAVVGLVAVSTFALTTVHREVVDWYSASQWCWALLALLWCLVILQADASGPGLWRVLVSVGAASLAPLNYSVGLFVGPLATVYLLARKCNGASISAARCAWPMVGTAMFLAIMVPLKARGIMERASYAGRPPAQAIDPMKGLLFGVQSTVDLLLLRNVGVESNLLLHREWCAGLFISIILLLNELVQRSRRPAPLILGIAIVVISYAVTLPLRSWVQYEQFLSWTRYQLFPQLGVALVASSAVAEFGPSWLAGRLMTCGRAVMIMALATIQFLIHAVL